MLVGVPTIGKSETPMLSTPPAATATELTEKRIFMLFPTPMFMGKLPDMSVCDRVEKKVRELQKSGKGRSAPKGASPAWMSRMTSTIYPR